MSWTVAGSGRMPFPPGRIIQGSWRFSWTYPKYSTWGVENEARDLAIYLLRYVRNNRLEKIGAEFNLSHYSSVINDIGRVKRRLNSHKKIWENIRVFLKKGQSKIWPFTKNEWHWTPNEIQLQNIRMVQPRFVSNVRHYRCEFLRAIDSRVSATISAVRSQL